jgi:hypothetical protein
MEQDEWLSLLGEWWSACDNISEHLGLLRLRLPSIGPARPMMEPEELAAWEALPDRVIIYRGARRYKLGASWTLERSVAELFPFRARYAGGGEPVLITAEVEKKNILAIKLDRNEHEAIIMRGRRIVSREPLQEPPASAWEKS